MLITSPALLFPSDDRRRRLPELTGDRITSVVKKKALLTSRGAEESNSAKKNKLKELSDSHRGLVPHARIE